jgi:hypothetical protein
VCSRAAAALPALSKSQKEAAVASLTELILANMRRLEGPAGGAKMSPPESSLEAHSVGRRIHHRTSYERRITGHSGVLKDRMTLGPAYRLFGPTWSAWLEYALASVLIRVVTSWRGSLLSRGSTIVAMPSIEDCLEPDCVAASRQAE